MLLFKKMMSLVLSLALLAGMLPPVQVSASETETIPQEPIAAETTAAPETTASAAEETTAVSETVETTEPAAETEETVSQVGQEEAYASGGVCGSNLTWTLSDSGVLTISGTGEMTHYMSQSELPWYSDCESITSVVFRSGVTVLGVNAFDGCTNLTSVTIPNTVTDIPQNVFFHCTSLPSIWIPASVTTISELAFSDCFALTGIWVDSGNPNYSSDASGVLFNKDKTKLLDAPGAMTGTYQIPDTVTSIGYGAFDYCMKLTGIEIPESVSSIDSNAFSSCYGLRSVTLPEGLTKIASGLFDFSYNLSEVSIPESVTAIDSYAFNGCSSLRSITIPKNVASIASKAFSDCRLLKEIHFSGNAPSINATAFANVTASAYYPMDNATWTADVMQNYGGTLTWLVDAELTVKTMPDKVLYHVGEGIDLTGLQLLLTAADGTEQTITAGIELISGDTSASGRIPVTVSYNGLEAQFEIGVHETKTGEFLQDSTGYPESSHNYPNKLDKTYTYTVEGASYLKLTFSSQTETESNYDFIYLYDGSDNLLGEYTGTALANKTITVTGDTVKIRLTSDSSDKAYGFSLSSIYAYQTVETHEKTEESVYTEHTCTADGYYTHTCLICGYTWTETVAGTAAHTLDDGVYTDPTCTADGYTTVKCLYCEYSTTQTDTGSALGHSNDEGVYTDPRCFADGYTTFTCTRCGATTKETDTGTAFHVFESGACTVCGVADTVLSGKWLNDTVYGATLPGSVLYIGGTGTIPSYISVGSPAYVVIGDGITGISSNAFYFCSSLKSVFIPDSVTGISGSSQYSTAFYKCPNDLRIYCEASGKKSGWETYWNCRESGVYLDVFYGTTRESYEYGITLDTTAEILVVPDSVSSLAPFTFSECANLKMVYIPATVEKIAAPYSSASPFNGCASTVRIYCEAATKGSWSVHWNYYSSSAALKTAFGISREDFDLWITVDTAGASVVLPEGLTVIPDNAFSGRTDLKSVTIPDSVTVIGKNAFSGCTGLTEVILPDNLTVLEANAFSGCTALTEITIPDGVTAIGIQAFQKCTGLTAATIADSVTAIGQYAFSGCTALAQMTLPNSLVTLDNYAFRNCTALTEVTVPGSVTTFGNYVFYGCTGLKEVTIEEGVTAIGEYAFQNCSALEKLTLPGSLATVGASAFSGCAALTEVHVADVAGWCAIRFGSYLANPLYYGDLYLAGEKVTDLVIPEGVTSIGAYAFYGSNLTSVTMPASLTSVGRNAFYYCSALTQAHVSDLTAWCGIEFEDSSANPLYYGQLYLDGRQVTELVIPEEVTAIGKYAFYNASALTSVTVYPGLKTVGSAAFTGCKGLTAVHICDLAAWCTAEFADAGANPLSLAKKLYLDGEQLTRLTVPAGVTAIGSYAFSGCEDLQSVTLPDGLTELRTGAFYKCTALETVNLPEGIVSIGEYAFYNGTALTAADFPETLTSIGMYAFYGCSTLTELTFPAALTAIGSRAFQDCKAVTRLEFLGDAPAIDSNAFYSVTADAWYPYDASGWTVSALVGYGGTLNWIVCSNADSVAQGACGDGITWRLDTQGGLLLSGSGKMPDYSISGSRTTAPWSSYVKSVKTVVVDKNITYMGKYAFYGCTNLGGITFLGPKPEFASYALYGVTATGRYLVSELTWIPTELAGYGGTITWDPIGATEEYLACSNLNLSIYWTLDKTGLLTIHGLSADYSSYSSVPWYPYRYYIREAVITSDNTSTAIGQFWFYDYPELTSIDAAQGYLTKVSSYACSYSPKLKSVDLGEGVSAIGDYAFEGCTALTSIFLAPYSSGWSIGDQAFSGCTALTEVSIPSEITLGAKVFSGCTALKSIYINECGYGSSFAPETDSFYSVTANVYYPRGSWSYSSTRSSYGGTLTWVESDFGTCGVNAKWAYDPEAMVLTLSGTGAVCGSHFSGNEGPWGSFHDEILIITVGEGITYIPSYTFEFCESATSITLPETLTALDLNAFNDCGSLNNLILPSSLEAFGSGYGSTFIRCESLRNVYYFGTEAEWAQIKNAENVMSYNSNMTLHFLVLDPGTATCTASGSQQHYHYDDTSVYDTLYDLDRTVITQLATVPALGHNYGDWITTREPSCTASGGQYRTCGRCGDTETRETAPLGHKYESVVMAPTCETGGYTTHTCVSCGDSYVDSETAALGHDLGEWVTVTAATCTADGEERRDCSRCDHFESKTVEKTGHSYERVVTAPGCESGGHTTHTCVSCGDSYVDSETAALGHDLGDWVTVTAATCTADGEERRDCSRCDHFESKTVEKTGHSYESVVTAPGCESGGYTTHTCVSCGDSYKDSQVAALGHDLGEWVTVTAATCTADGEERRDCSRCDHFESKTVEKTGHSYESVVTAPGCESGGYTTNTCVSCGDSYVDSETAALGHDLGEWITVTPPTCTTEGWQRRDCSRCDVSELDWLLATGHSSQDIPEVAPTCTETGLTAGEICSVCQEILKPQETVEALGHDYVNFLCTRCGAYAEGSGAIGEDLHWGVDTENGQLTITGTGILEDSGDAPWAEYGDTVTELVIGEGVTGIGEGVFEDLENLKEILVDDNNPSYASQDGILFSRDLTELIRYPGGREETAYTVPETVTKIHDNAFAGSDLEELHFTGAMPEFDDNAFAGLNVTVYYPGGDPTWEKDKLLPYGGEITWVPVYDQPEVIRVVCDRLTLLQGETANLTAERNFGEEPILWSLAEGDAEWAELVSDGVTATLTAKPVTQKQTVTVTARTAGGITEAQVQIQILPRVTQVRILAEEGREVSGTTVWFDLNSGKDSLFFSAALLPADAPQEVSWQCEDTEGVYGTYVCRDGGFEIRDFTGKTGTVAITATAIDGSGCGTGVYVKFVSLTPETEEIPGENPADLNLVSGGKKTLKVYDSETGKALTCKQITWSLDSVYEPYATLTKDGKLTAKKVVQQVRIEAVGTITGSEGTRIVMQVDIFPAVTQMQVWDGDSLVGGKTIPFDLGSYDSKTLAVRLFPEDVMDVPVTWTVSDSKNAFARYQINAEDNTLTIHSPTNKQGTVTLKATAQDGSKKAVTVKLKFCILTRSVTIGIKGSSESAESCVISGGQGVQLEAAVKSPVMGVNPTDPKVVWSLADANDKNYVNLSSNGKVTAKDVSASRDVKILATAKDGGGAQDSFVVTVMPKDTGMLTLLHEGENVTKGTVLVDLNGDDRSVTISAHTFGETETEQVAWEPLTSRVANLTQNSDGSLTVQMVSAGTQTVKATAADGRKASVTIKAVRMAASVSVSQKKTGIDQGLELASGRSLDLQAVVTGTTAQKVTWSIPEGGAYASVSTSGKVTAAKDLTRAHSVTVRATAADGSGAFDELTLTVRPIAQGVQVYTVENGVRTFSVRSSNWWVRSNTNLQWDLSSRSDTVSLNANVYPYYGSDDSRNALQAVQWKSSAPKVADFLRDDSGALLLDEDGNVQLKISTTGSTTITVTADDGSKQKITFKLTVVKQVTSLTLEDQVIAGGKSLNLAKLIVINPADATNKKLTWSITSGSLYGTLSSSGTFRAKKVTEPQQVQITVRSQDGGAETTCTVTINP